ncbi:hypothetical protein ROZALSC1DRAFT_27099 [Rozella allomycis CSF55]|uniref:Importin N-terminal domain-containing protein n=1 Tax=Rozella allomycis (strain CSF55) TaxID=988480 RepID=A0A4P9YPE6_ROZAC|nr:hypothetical protein ROZALSC1DRAFT_27099 [Rozella allomycis CSF55]
MEKVLEALQVLYFSSDNYEKRKANKWLESFQTTKNAWTIVDMILSNNSYGPEPLLFAAQTLRKKAREGVC